ncbi:MAG: hypothetical protein Q9222_003693 [Ikaeria aurantiellina]
MKIPILINNLDGWEEEDNAVGEHVNLSPDCGWAVIARIEQDVEAGNNEHEDPMDERLLDARKMTFGANWPHEHKKGWMCKTQKMIEAGCFFALANTENKKVPRGKKGRVSKAARLSVQSNLTTASEDISMMDIHGELNTTPATSDIYGAGPTQTSKGSRKGVRSKKSSAKQKDRVAASQQEEAVVGSSFIEPEDDNFDVKVPSKPIRGGRPKKRKSDEMSVDDDSIQIRDTVHQVEPPSQAQPRKRRATRNSIAHEDKAPISTLELTLDDDTSMTDIQGVPPPAPPKSKKGAKGGRKRASTTTRKASTASTASKASLRANVPDDEDIDAALEADLDRPLTDDEADMDPPSKPPTKTRRLTRTRPGSRNVTASTAPVRRGTRASAVPVEGDSSVGAEIIAQDAGIDSVEDGKAIEIALDAMDHAKEEIIMKTAQNTASKAKARGRPPSAPKATRVASQKINNSQRGLDEPLPETQPSEENADHQLPEKLALQSTRTSAASVRDIVEGDAREINISTHDPVTARGDGDDEASVQPASQKQTKKGGKKRTGPAKKGRIGKEAPEHQDDEEHIVPVPMEDAQTKGPKVVIEVKPVPKNQSLEESAMIENVPPKRPSVGQAKTVRSKKVQTAKAKVQSTQPTMVASSTEDLERVIEPSGAAQKEVPPEGERMREDTADRERNQVDSVRSPTPQTQVPSVQTTPKMVPSPQSSDAENQPPSSRPSALRPPLSTQSPSKAQNTRVVLAATTPTTSPSKRNVFRLQSTFPWTAVDFEKVLAGSPAADKENISPESMQAAKQVLTSPEKKLTVEEWIRWNAKRGEEKLRDDCERLVGRFEGEGVRALKALEGIVCAE